MPSIARRVSAPAGAMASETGAAAEPEGRNSSRERAAGASLRSARGSGAGRALASAPPRRSAATSSGVVAERRASRSVLPRERSVSRSVPSKTSARRCVMRTTARPSSALRRSARKSAAVSSGREDRRRLVQDEDVRVGLERPGDPDPLAGPDGQLPGARVRAPEVEAGGAGEAVDPGAARAGGLEGRSEGVEQREVVGDARRLDEEIVLGDEGDAGPPRGARVAEGDEPSLPANLAGVGLQEPGGDGDERRLAGAVLAEEGVDLARLHPEARPVEGADRAERPPDARQLEREGARRHRDVGGAANPRLRSSPAGRRPRPRRSAPSSAPPRRRREPGRGR